MYYFWTPLASFNCFVYSVWNSSCHWVDVWDVEGERLLHLVVLIDMRIGQYVQAGFVVCQMTGFTWQIILSDNNGSFVLLDQFQYIRFECLNILYRQVEEWMGGWLGRHLEDWLLMDSPVSACFGVFPGSKKVLEKTRHWRWIAIKPRTPKCSDTPWDHSKALVNNPFHDCLHQNNKFSVSVPFFVFVGSPFL